MYVLSENILNLGNTTISNVECYDAVKNEWFPVSSMNLNRSALSACVLSGLPNAKEYSYTDKNYHYMNAGMSEAIPPTTDNDNTPETT